MRPHVIAQTKATNANVHTIKRETEAEFEISVRIECAKYVKPLGHD